MGVQAVRRTKSVRLEALWHVPSAFHKHFSCTLCIRATVCLRARTSHVSKPRTLNPKHKPLNPVYVLACMPLRFRAEKGAAVAAGTAGSCTNARQGPGPALHRNHMADGGT